MQLSTDGVHYADLATLTLSGNSSEWIAFDAMLPDTLTEEMKRISISVGSEIRRPK